MQQLDDTYNELPEALQDYIMSQEVAESVHLISDEYLVPESKEDDFALKIFALLTGTYYVDEFIQEISREYNFPEDVARQVLIDIDELILDPSTYAIDPDAGEEDTGIHPKEPQSPLPPLRGNDGTHDNESSIQRHILDEIEHPTPSPMTSSPRSSYAPPVGLRSKPAVPALIPQSFISNTHNVASSRLQFVAPVPEPVVAQNLPTARVIPPMQNQGILRQQVETVHNLDMQPNLPDHHEDLMPLIVKQHRSL
ncbi:hypothetical protein KW782_01925 [Candidatus Parcubacteria bacterium]|nr:hypothetical protein [Candidatus Parcubacteria bacterium]